MSESATSAPLQPLQAPRSLAEDAADRIREQILAGGFQPGRAPRRSQDRRAAQHQPWPGARGVQAASGRGPAERGAPAGHLRGQPQRRRRPRDLRAARRAGGSGGSIARPRPRPRDDRAAPHPRRRRSTRPSRRATAPRSRAPTWRSTKGSADCAATPGSSRSSIATCPRSGRCCASTSGCCARWTRSRTSIGPSSRPSRPATRKPPARLLAEHAEQAGELIAGVVAANEAAAD